MNRIFYDARTRRYGGSVELQDGTESIGDYATEGEAQLAWLRAQVFYNGRKPSDATLPATENVVTPNPLAAFYDATLAEEMKRRSIHESSVVRTVSD